MTGTDTRCFMGSIAYTLGDLKHISEIKELKETPDLLEIFQNRGLEYYAETNLSPVELAQACVKQTLERAAYTPESIDAFIYVTETQKTEVLNTGPGISFFLTEMGLKRAYPIGISCSQCANLSAAIRVASSLVRVGAMRRILVVVVEKVGTQNPFDELNMRLTNEPGMPVCSVEQPLRLTGELGMTVCSDGAASFIISADPGLEYEILNVGQHSAPEVLTKLLNDEMDDFFTQTAEGTRSAVEEALHPHRVSPSDVRRVLTNNCGMHIQRQLLHNGGFELAQGFFDNIPRFGHAFSVDNIANLCDSEIDNPLTVGDDCVLLFTAVNSWGAVLLRKNAMR